MENPNFSYGRNNFLSTTNCVELITFTQPVWKGLFKKVSHRKRVWIPQMAVEDLQGAKQPIQETELFCGPAGFCKFLTQRQELILAVMSRILS